MYSGIIASFNCRYVISFISPKMRNLQIRLAKVHNFDLDVVLDKNNQFVKWDFCEQSQNIFFEHSKKVFRKPLDEQEAELIAE